jgi:hypothetical protein
MALFNTTTGAPVPPPAPASKHAPDVMMLEGAQKATVVRALPKMTQTGKLMFSLKWEDEFKRSAWQNIVISPESEKAMKFFYGRLMPVFGLTQAIIEADDTTHEDIANDMTGCTALITVEHSEYNGTTRASVRWIESI